MCGKKPEGRKPGSDFRVAHWEGAYFIYPSFLFGTLRPPCGGALARARPAPCACLPCARLCPARLCACAAPARLWRLPCAWSVGAPKGRAMIALNMPYLSIISGDNMGLKAYGEKMGMARASGTGATISLPRSWVGLRVLVVLLDRVPNKTYLDDLPADEVRRLGDALEQMGKGEAPTGSIKRAGLGYPKRWVSGLFV
jgi:hypothetical protein